MKEQQVDALIAALQAETQAKKEQTAALTRLAESNESLVAVLVDAFSSDADLFETPPIDDQRPQYLGTRG
ncbi:hypothetical protein SERVES_01644 [Serratia ficaria]|uniref:hypothetical protein n=1 Tax=Serratia ficaria TaxID=61651 RepID=UPI001199364E|nr:hypothetical protein [Serratia ficaria]VVA47923.1 hypothetical protein SERVES_01644 [Serratia ficaria]